MLTSSLQVGIQIDVHDNHSCNECSSNFIKTIYESGYAKEYELTKQDTQE